MTTSRRDFVKQGSLVALTAGVSMRLAGNVVGKEAIASEGHVSKNAFESRLNSKFVIHSRNTKVSTRLVSVSDLVQRARKEDGKEGYSLLFTSNGARKLEQGTYQVQHKELGSFSLFIVPVNRSSSKVQHYEAVINRLYP